MSNLTPSAAWSDVYKIESADLVIGGANTAICNKQAQSLINQIEALKNLIDAFEAQVNTLDDPILMIKMWYGNLSTIPAGWQLCNGTNGTPNLTNKFIQHSTLPGSGSDGVYFYLSPSNISISLAGAHSHNAFSLSYSGAHSHSGTLEKPLPVQATQGYEWRGSGGACSSVFHTHPFTTSISGNHTHTVNFDSVSNHTHSIGSSLALVRSYDPPYCNIYYIMRIS